MSGPLGIPACKMLGIKPNFGQNKLRASTNPVLPFDHSDDSALLYAPCFVPKSSLVDHEDDRCNVMDIATERSGDIVKHYLRVAIFLIP